jgi:hypothetical protein
MKITFTESAKPFILAALGMSSDKEGCITDLKTNEKVLDYNGDKVHITKFAGFQKDFGIITSDLNCMIALSDYLKKENE